MIRHGFSDLRTECRKKRRRPLRLGSREEPRFPGAHKGRQRAEVGQRPGGADGRGDRKGDRRANGGDIKAPSPNRCEGTVAQPWQKSK
jgi:hypothetical protein